MGQACWWEQYSPLLWQLQCLLHLNSIFVWICDGSLSPPTSFNVFYIFGSLFQVAHFLWASPPPRPREGREREVQELKHRREILWTCTSCVCSRNRNPRPYFLYPSGCQRKGSRVKKSVLAAQAMEKSVCAWQEGTRCPASHSFLPLQSLPQARIQGDFQILLYPTALRYNEKAEWPSLNKFNK